MTVDRLGGDESLYWALHHGRDGLRDEWQIALFHPTLTYLPGYYFLFWWFVGGGFCGCFLFLISIKSFALRFFLYHSVRGLVTDHA